MASVGNTTNGAAATLLRQLLERGQITQTENNTLSTFCVGHVSTGNCGITITSPPVPAVRLRELDVTARVFNTGELLGLILEQLPLADLLHLPLVCKGFKKFIDGSAPIRRMLHLEPRNEGLTELMGIPIKLASLDFFEGCIYFNLSFGCQDAKIWQTPSKLHDILIVQPPLKDFTLRTRYYRRNKARGGKFSREVLFQGKRESYEGKVLTFGVLSGLVSNRWKDSESDVEVDGFILRKDDGRFTVDKDAYDTRRVEYHRALMIKDI